MTTSQVYNVEIRDYEKAIPGDWKLHEFPTDFITTLRTASELGFAILITMTDEEEGGVRLGAVPESITPDPA